MPRSDPRLPAPGPPRVGERVSLREHNTFRLDVKARYFAEVSSVPSLRALLEERRGAGRILVLGRGANILFRGDFDGLVLKARLLGRRVVAEDSENVVYEIGAGEDWPRLVESVVKRGLGGIENLALVPGTVGAAPVQHIACYGHNLRDVFVSLRAVSLSDGSAKEFGPEECGFLYRDSVFRQALRGRWVITSVRLRLSRKPVLCTGYRSRYESLEEELSQIARSPYTVSDVYRAVVRIRKRKLPDLRKVGCAGSFFKNPTVSRDDFLVLRRLLPGLQFYPADQLSYAVRKEKSLPENPYVKIPAGWLIDEMGWKGRRAGDVGLWPKQSLNVVNYGNAGPGEVLDFVESVRAEVLRRYGVALENEVEVV